jgi:hypothetical protein
MKVVQVQIELVINDDIKGMFTPRYVHFDKIADYLNNKLYTDPEFFGDFGPENILSVKEFE